jgi:2-aminoethylphosphonate-pyruvate transaminase
LNPAAYEVVLMQGSGTYGVESVISTVLPKVNAKLLIIINGNYGMRMAQMAEIHGISTVRLAFDESDVPDEMLVLQTLNDQPDITHVALVHSETTTGIVNPLERLAKLIKSKNKVLIVDGMSSFGAIPFDVSELDIDFAVGSANKGFQGIPGFCFIIAKRSELIKCEGNGRTLSLDMFEQWRFAEKTKGSFRFTPPVHALRAFHEAMLELRDEGGVRVRFERFTENQRLLVDGMAKLGFKAIDLKGYQGPVITSFHSPTCPKYNFSKFYQLLKEKRCVLYPGKLTKADTFRIGSISVNKSDILDLLDLIKDNIFWDQNLVN